MPKYTLVRLHHFKGGLHLARGLTNAYDKSLRTLHSDTLKSAIFVNALQLDASIGENEKDAINNDFLNSFQISSAFPFYKKSEAAEPYYFFPKPELPRLFEGDFVGLEKKLKKIQFMEKSIFLAYLKNRQDEMFLPQNIEKTKNIEDPIYIRGNYLVKDRDETFKEILKKGFWTSSTYQHVTIPRDYGSDSTPYYVDKLFFHKNAGLFFLLKTNDNERLKQIKAALRLLADNGIGTDRNSGNGQFEVDFEDNFELDTDSGETHQMSLSLYCPHQSEIEALDDSYYQLVKRGGYISSPKQESNLSIRKRSIYMFKEGSLFPKLKGRKGKLVNLRPEHANVNHPIWRDGQSIFIPMNYKNNEK